MSLQEELFSAIIRATFLEGKIYVVESGGDVVTVCLVFREPASLFGSYVLCLLSLMGVK